MRNAIREYLNYSDEEKAALWDSATFVFDTNVYLNLYRYTGRTRDLLLSAFQALQGRLWMPNHVAHEFMERRCKVIIESCNQYDKLQKEASDFIKHCRTSLRLEQNEQSIDELNGQITKWIDTTKKANVVVSDPNSDEILNQLLALYEGRVGEPFSSEELNEAEAEGKGRYAEEIPPGYKDANKQAGEKQNNTYGDFYIWKQILNYASREKKDIILVTNDQKEDWWETVSGKTIGPRVELRKEFYEKCGQRFLMYSMRNFITRFENNNNVQISRDTINEIEFFSKVIHHKTPKQVLGEYYNSFEDIDEARAAKKRFKLMKLEAKNQKRQRIIAQIREKYNGTEMPADIEMMMNNTEANYQKTKLQIEKMKLSLFENEYQPSL